VVRVVVVVHPEQFLHPLLRRACVEVAQPHPVEEDVGIDGLGCVVVAVADV